MSKHFPDFFQPFLKKNAVATVRRDFYSRHLAEAGWNNANCFLPEKRRRTIKNVTLSIPKNETSWQYKPQRIHITKNNAPTTETAAHDDKKPDSVHVKTTFGCSQCIDFCDTYGKNRYILIFCAVKRHTYLLAVLLFSSAPFTAKNHQPTHGGSLAMQNRF